MDIGTKVKLEANSVVLFGTLIEQDDLGFTVADSLDGARYSVPWQSLFDGSVSIEAVIETGSRALKQAA